MGRLLEATENIFNLKRMRRAESGCRARTDTHTVHRRTPRRESTAQRRVASASSDAPHTPHLPPPQRPMSVQRPCSAHSRNTTSCHARACSSKPAAVGRQWPTTAGRPSMARSLGAAALPSRGLDGGRDARVCEHASRDALRLSGRPRAAHAMGREAASGAMAEGRREGTWQPREARRRPGRPPRGAVHGIELSSVADLPLDIDFLSSDSMSICPAHLLEGRVAGAKVRR